jgi:hypothetical protein
VWIVEVERSEIEDSSWTTLLVPLPWYHKVESRLNNTKDQVEEHQEAQAQCIIFNCCPAERYRHNERQDQHQRKDNVLLQVGEASLRRVDDGVRDDGDCDGVDGSLDAFVFLVHVEHHRNERSSPVEVKANPDSDAVDIGVADELA